MRQRDRKAGILYAVEKRPIHVLPSFAISTAQKHVVRYNSHLKSAYPYLYFDFFVIIFKFPCDFCDFIQIPM